VFPFKNWVFLDKATENEYISFQKSQYGVPFEKFSRKKRLVSVFFSHKLEFATLQL